MYRIGLMTARFYEDGEAREIVVDIKGFQKWEKTVEFVKKQGAENPDNLYQITNTERWARKWFQGWWLNGVRVSTEQNEKPSVTYEKRFKISEFYVNGGFMKQRADYAYISHIEALAINSNSRTYSPYIYIAESVEDGKKYYHFASKWIDETEANSIMQGAIDRENAKKLWVIPKDVNNIGWCWDLKLETFQHKDLSAVARQLASVRDLYQRVADIDGVSMENATKLTKAKAKLQEAIDILNKE